jgi:hypothetical protein
VPFGFQTFRDVIANGLSYKGFYTNNSGDENFEIFILQKKLQKNPTSQTLRNFIYSTDKLQFFSGSIGHVTRQTPPKFELDTIKHDRVVHVFVKKPQTSGLS